MALGEYLTAGTIIPEMRATERYAAIEELVNIIVESGQICEGDREEVL